MNANLTARLAASVRDPGATAIETPSGALITYGALLERVAHMAGALQAAGLGPGDRLAVQVEKSVEGIVLALATMHAGGVLLPLNIAYTPAEIAYFLEDAEPGIVVLDPARVEASSAVTARIGARVLTLDRGGQGSLADAAAEGAAVEPVARSGDDLAAILYTSGTTGRSKGAMLTHDNLVSNALTLCEAWRFTPDDVLVHALPIFHTHGLFVATNVVLFSGAAMIVLPGFDAKKILALLPRATSLMGVPTFYTRLLQEPGLTRQAVANVRLFVSGSAPLLADTHRAWSERTGHAILERYGMTETGMNTSNPYEGARVPGAVGPTLLGIEARVNQPETDEPVEPGEIGMIEVRGPNVFKGYWRMPEKTAAELRPDGWFITGDLGWIDEAGYVWIVGRGKDLIITGGYNVYPKEIESEIDALEGVVESAVFGIPHADFGEAVAAAVVAVPGASLDAEAIVATLSDRLARFKLPKRVVILDELPRNTMGKVQKNVLRDRYGAV